MFLLLKARIKGRGNNYGEMCEEVEGERVWGLVLYIDR